jgi:hypothetical protein
VDPVRNPYAPGAGQRPPELAGRDRELEMFEVVLERVARSRPERSLVLTGLRGVGKTVLLNTLRSQAIGRLWGSGKIEARPDQSLRRPVAAALHMAVRELAPHHRAPDRIDQFLGVLKAFGARSVPANAKLRDRWNPGIDVPATAGRADSGDIEIDLVELFTDAASVATDVGTGIALFIDEMQDVPADDVSALCAACHELSQTGAPLIVVGAGLPHLPALLSASKSYSERLFRYQRIDRLDRLAADQAFSAPAAREGVDYEPKALDALYDTSGGYPYFVQAYGKATWDHAPRSPITPGDPGRAGVHADHGRARRRRRHGHRGTDGRHRQVARAQAGQPVPGPRRPDQEGPDLLRRARHGRVHRAALRPVPAIPTHGRRLTTRRVPP